MIRRYRTITATMGRCSLALMLMLAWTRNVSAAPMVYSGLVVTDVRVGETFMHNASLKITFEGDTENIIPVTSPASDFCSGSSFYYLASGVARIEIQFRGRTQTARFQDGQVVVTLDTCSGGIGFGSFLAGRSGLEPAYPLAFTMGTAEYAAITSNGPLGEALSLTGAAWSCLGFPPVYVTDQESGTTTQNCIPPGAYPLKSDIGDIFIYQPYYELDPSSSLKTELESNHSGSTNRGAFLVRPKANGTLSSSGALESAHGSGVVYTLQTVADGSIGEHVFSQALVNLSDDQ
jgi:hypothetical protein